MRAGVLDRPVTLVAHRSLDLLSGRPDPGQRTTAADRQLRRLLERDSQLGVLAAAVADAVAGRSSAALVTGEAGIGKTSLVRAFLRAVRPDIRVLSGGCDDLLTPRPLGPLVDAAAGTGGPLERALASGGSDAVFAAVVGELSGPTVTVLVVEDAHWADDATLDVLRYVARRLPELRVLLVLTYRDEAGPALRPLLGALAGQPVHRLALPALSAAAVAALAASTTGSDHDTAALHALTGGNPFYVTEVLAAPGDRVPPTVVDTVLARMRGIGPAAQAACEQLSVVPRPVGFDQVAALLEPAAQAALAEAEEHGILEVRPTGVAFRHELARRAVEGGLPAIRRRQLNAAVVAALRAADRPDLAQLVHHAVRAGDAATVLEYAPLAGREAALAGSHRQALGHFEAALCHADLLPVGERAALVDDHAWELHIAHRFGEAVLAGREAVRLRELAGEPVALGETLLRLARHLHLDGHIAEALATVERAGQVLRPTGSASALAAAATHRGAMLALIGRPADALTALDQASELASAAGRADLVALCLNYAGLANADLDHPDGVRLLRESLATAAANGDHEPVARAYANLGAVLYRDGRWDEAAECVEAGLAFTVERGFWVHAFSLDVHGALLLMRRGAWDAAEQRLLGATDGVDDPGMLSVYSAPAMARLRARRGDQDVLPMLEAAWRRATEQRLPLGLGHAGMAYVEWAWLSGDPATAAAVRDVLLPHTELPGSAAVRGELLRYLARAGLPAEPFDGCPEPWAAGLRGDWQAAAAAWEHVGDPYEQALELAESGELEPTLRALRILDDLGAAPAATLVRGRLRKLGARRVPRGAQPATRANPAGLTGRQVDVLHLVASGLTNAEIAARLVVSVRTVDHHVSAILAKLGVRTRREAATAAPSLGLSVAGAAAAPAPGSGSAMGGGPQNGRVAGTELVR